MEIIRKEANKNLNQKVKLIIILAVEFVAIMTILLLILFAGKKTHTVTFDLNGGILISGDLEQRVTQGQSAHPPSVAKFGHYLRGWSGSYKSVTRSVTVKAIWEYETSPGIEYYFPEHTNYCEISGSFKEIQGEIFIGSYYNERQVLGIQAGAFKDRTGITSVHLLDGILAIEEEAFAGCTSLEVVDVPSTVVRIGKGAFAGCEKLKEIILPKSLKTIEEGAFAGCSSIETIVFEDKLETIGDYAFAGCSSVKEINLPKGVLTIGNFAFSNCTSLESLILYRDPSFYEVPGEEESDDGESKDKNDKDKGKDKNSKDENDETDEEIVEDDGIVRGVTKIGAYAFYGCEKLIEVTIPETVTEIGQEAFNTPKMTINLYIKAEELPIGYVEGWHAADATLVFEYEPPVVEEEAPEEEDKDDKKNNLWGKDS